MNDLNSGFKSGLAAAILFCMLMLTGCDITNPMEGIRAILNTKERVTTVSVIILDAATDEPVGYDDGIPVSVTITGPGSGHVTDLFNRPSTQFDASSGFLTFAIRDEIIPGESQPVEITLELEAEGYMPAILPLRISATGNTPVDVTMINTANLPDGVRGIQNMSIGSALPDGRVPDEIVFGTESNLDSGTASVRHRRNDPAGFRLLDNRPPDPPVSGIDLGVRFTIEGGTVIRDAGGNPLSGQLNTTFYYYGPHFHGLDRFGQAIIDETVSDRIFMRTGSVDVVIRDSQGRIAKSFDPPVQTTFTYREESASSGAVIPIWTAESSHPSSWTYAGEKEVTEIEDAFGRDVSRSATLFPTFPRWQSLAHTLPACRNGVRIDITGSRLRLWAEIVDAGTGYYYGSAESTVDDSQNYFRLRNVPRGRPAVLKLYNINNNLIDEIEIADLCASTTLSAHVDSPEFTATFIGVGVCANNEDIEIRPNFPAQYRSSFSRWRPAGLVKNGRLELTLPERDVYLFSGFFEGRTYVYEIDLTDADGDLVIRERIELPRNVCEEL